MKAIFTIILLCFINMKIIAENNDSTAFNLGKIILNVGYGFPNLDKAAFDNNFQWYRNDTYKSMGYGPFHFRAEYGVSDKIGIGVSFNYDTYGGTWSEDYIINNGFGSTQYYTYHFKKTMTALTGLIRFNYHVFTTKKLDPYFALGVGFKNIKKTATSDDPDSKRAEYILKGYNDSGANNLPADAACEAVAGMRYYFTPHIGIYSEMGIAKSLIQLGVSIGF